MEQPADSEIEGSWKRHTTLPDRQVTRGPLGTIVVDRNCNDDPEGYRSTIAKNTRKDSLPSGSQKPNGEIQDKRPGKKIIEARNTQVNEKAYENGQGGTER